MGVSGGGWTFGIFDKAPGGRGGYLILLSARNTPQTTPRPMSLLYNYFCIRYKLARDRGSCT